jgi:hypothetical protein
LAIIILKHHSSTSCAILNFKGTIKIQFHPARRRLEPLLTSTLHPKENIMVRVLGYVSCGHTARCMQLQIYFDNNRFQQMHHSYIHTTSFLFSRKELLRQVLFQTSFYTSGNCTHKANAQKKFV